MKRLLSLVLALMLVTGLGLAAQLPEDAKEGGTLVLHETGDPRSFNPTMAADDNLYAIAQNLFNRLTKLDASKSPIPDAAKSWDVSEDGKDITFHLKENMKWHDGEAMDAEDVKYTFDYIKATPTTYFSSSMSIVDSIEVVDPLTVVFHLNTPDMSFIARIGWYATFILPEHIFNNGQAWEDNPATLSNPIGSGPFKFDSYKQGEYTVLVKNPDYHDGAPILDKLIFSIVPDDATAVQAFINGELDNITNVPTAYVQQFLADEKIRMDRNMYPSPYRIIFNVNADIVKDVAVRRAIAYCVDRNDISNKVYDGIMPPEWSVYPSIVEWAANTEDIYPDVDLAMAEKILQDAGYTKDADGYYVTGISIDVFTGLEDSIKLIIANAEKAGIKIDLNLMEYNAWSEKVGKQRDFMIEAQGGFMGPDPAQLATRYGTGMGSNYSGWSNAEFDELCALAAKEPNTEKRAELYKKAQKIVLDNMVVINMVGYAAYEASRSDVMNLPIDGTGKWGWNEYTFTYFKK